MLELVLPPGHAIVAMGSNLGDRTAHLDAALDALTAAGVRVLDRSRLYDTAPVGPPQPRYLNAAVRVDTRLTPHDLLARLLRIEREHGRDRTDAVLHGPRTLDLDLLVYADAVIDSHALTLPHPRMFDRTFVLAPLVDLLPDAPGLAERLRILGGPERARPWRLRKPLAGTRQGS